RLCLALTGRLEVGARLESRGSGWCVLLLAASGGGLVTVTPRPPWALGPVLWVAAGRLSRRGSDRAGVWFCFILRQGVCRLLECDIPYVAFWFDGLRQGWYCDRGYVAFLKATHPLSPSGSQCDTRCVAFSGSRLKARAPELFSISRVFPFPLSPSRPLGVPAVLGVPPPC
ncbi:hypothetical protein Taro_025674, partial [Colocasia esculenta]|nr:hypothetical protein [Colocasia esculenta]